MLFLLVFLVFVVVTGSFARDNCVRCSVGVTRRRVTVERCGRTGMLMVYVMTLVFLVDDLGRFMLFLLVLCGLMFVAMLVIMMLFTEERMTVI